ncbi:MAG: tetratricopeptide repeat protein [Sandaracinaceae bacterium]
MAKAKKGKFPKPRDTSKAIEEIERPTMKWKTVGIIVAAFVTLWVTALMILSMDNEGVFGWVVVGVVAALSVAAIGFGIYIWRLTQRSAGIVDILAQATDEEGRKRAIQQLAEGDSSDAMNALARAQLVARDNPNDAIKILEEIDVDKAPAVVQDDVRANLGFLYLMNNRAKDARRLADDLRLDRQPNPKAKAMYAAVSAEAFARTGKVDEAKKLIETYDATDPDYEEVAGMLYRAQVYTYLKGKNRGLAQRAMKNLAKIDPNLLAPFVGKRVRPELQKMARSALKSVGLAPKQKMKVQRR